MEAVHYANNIFEAQLLASFLEGYDIVAVADQGQGSTLVGAGGYLDAQHAVRVDADRADEARTLIREEFTAWRARGESADAFDDDDPEVMPAPSAPLRSRRRVLVWGVTLIALPALVGLVLMSARRGLPEDTSAWAIAGLGAALYGCLLFAAWRRWGRTPVSDTSR